MKLRHFALVAAVAFAVGACAQSDDKAKMEADKMKAEEAAKAKKKAAAAAAAKKNLELAEKNTAATRSAYEKFKKAEAAKKAKEALLAKNTAETRANYEKFKMAQGNQYVVYFGLNSTSVDAAGAAIVAEAAAKAKGMSGSKVKVVGHTDTAGPENLNQKVSEARANAVAKALAAAGVKASAEGYGESVPAVDTGDGVKNDKNRRAVISIR